MSSGGQRQAVFPTRMALTTLKQRQVGAQKGYELLKKKSDALMARLRAMLVEIKNVREGARARARTRRRTAQPRTRTHGRSPTLPSSSVTRPHDCSLCSSPTRAPPPHPPPPRPLLQTKLLVAKEMQGATFCISEAVWAAGDFRKRVVDAPQRERSLVRVKVKHDNVAGVKLPVFSIVRSAGNVGELETLGISGGGRQIRAARDKFTALLDLLIKLGSLQTSFLTLDEAIKVTNRRVNALDNVSLRGPRAPALARCPPMRFCLTSPCPPPPPFPPLNSAGCDPLFCRDDCVRDVRVGRD